MAYYCRDCGHECEAEIDMYSVRSTQSTCCLSLVYHDAEMKQLVQPEDLPDAQAWITIGAMAQEK